MIASPLPAPLRCPRHCHVNFAGTPKISSATFGTGPDNDKNTWAISA